MNSVPLVTIILGTRPEAIKLAPLIIAFNKSEKFKIRVILTGQHIDLVAPVMKIFDIKYDLNLKLMKHNQTLSFLTISIINALEEEFKKYRPSLVVVQGDTTTAFAAALASFYEKVPVAHVEAGLRTNDIMSPYPEEANRRLISQLSTIHFAPTELSKKNLIESGVTGTIIITGNTVIDALLIISKKEVEIPTKKVNWLNQRVIFATIHRRENWGENIHKIAKAILRIVNEIKNTAIIIPLHPNKKVRDIFNKLLSNHPNIDLIEPLNYHQSISCMKKSTLILTDSGGIQEEAPSLCKPVLILRDKTERQEAIKAGTAKIVGTDPEVIFNETKNLLTNSKEYFLMANSPNPYGNGKACEIILNSCEDFLSKKI